MIVSNSTKKPALQRSIAYGAPYAYEKLAEKNQSILRESSISLDSGSGGRIGNVVTVDEFTIGSLSSVLLSFDNRSVASSDDGSYSYSYSAVSDEAEAEELPGRLGATPSKKRGGFPSRISPVKSDSEEANNTLEIPGCSGSDWSVDIGRMMPAVLAERGDDEEAIAQDAFTTRGVASVASLEGSPNEATQTESEDDSIAINLSAQLESLGLRLESLEKAIFSDSEELNRTDDGDQNMAFIVEEEDSTVESVAKEDIVLAEEIDSGISLAEEMDNGNARNACRSKQSFFVRFFLFGGCRKH
eukprot:scaffold44949_cov124-Skeletonema_marinoi.AAC.1